MTEKQFIEEVVEEINRKQFLVIYGMGMVGKLVYSRLISNGLEKNIIGFAVSHRNVNTYLDMQVYEISELIKYKESVYVFIATLPGLHTEILNTLHQYGFFHVCKVTEELYQDMAANYVEEFRKKHVFIKDSIDVLLMASDNNSSSGAFLCLADLSVELSQRGISNVVVLPEYGNGEDILLKKNIDFVYIPSISWTRKSSELWQDEEIELNENIKAIEEIEKFIVQHQVKLVHNNTTYTYVGAVAARNKKIPFVWHIRENIYEQGCSFINDEKSIKFINQSEKIIAVSKFITSSYQGLDSGKLCVCYDGVNIKDYYDEEKLLFKKEKMLITQIGSVAPVKNQKDLIEAAHILKKKKINFMVQFVGNGDKDYIEELKKMVKKYHLEKEVIFRGRTDNVYAFYQEADIIAVCSRAEAFGRTTVEAQLAGCLVIGADAGATSELIEDGETGFLYKQGNIRNFVEKIIYALTNKEISEKIAANGQKHAYRLYTKERNAEEIINIYEELLSN